MRYCVAFGIYKTDGCVASASENGGDVYATALETFSSHTNTCEETDFCVLGI